MNISRSYKSLDSGTSPKDGVVTEGDEDSLGVLVLGVSDFVLLSFQKTSNDPNAIKYYESPLGEKVCPIAFAI